MTRVIFIMLLLVLGLCAANAAEVPAPTVTKELVQTPTGKAWLWYRTPATPEDFQLPFVPQAEFQQSYAYRIRDRKNRDLMSYACVRMTTTRPIEEVLEQYTKALGGAVQRSTDKETGEITLLVGEEDHFRLVVVEPRGATCHVRLEHVQQFTVPARVFTPAEQRVIALLEAVAAQYRAAPQVAYTLDQQEEPKTTNPALHWTIQYQQPNRITVNVLSGKDPTLEISTHDGKLVVHHAGEKEEQRAFTTPGRITMDLLPELRDEPVARLLLGETLITPALDYLALLSVEGVPLTQQAEVVLTYPDLDVTLRLRIDMARKLILRSESRYQTADDAYRIVRAYADYTLLPTPATPAASATPGSQPTPATAAPGL